MSIPVHNTVYSNSDFAVIKMHCKKNTSITKKYIAIYKIMYNIIFILYYVRMYNIFKNMQHVRKLHVYTGANKSLPVKSGGFFR